MTNKYEHLRPPQQRQPNLVRMHANKRRMRTLEAAERVRDNMQLDYGERFSAYFCPVCQGYHVGHTIGMRSVS